MYYPHSAAKNVFRAPEIWHQLSLNHLAESRDRMRDARKPTPPPDHVHGSSLVPASGERLTRHFFL